MTCDGDEEDPTTRSRDECVAWRRGRGARGKGMDGD